MYVSRRAVVGSQGDELVMSGGATLLLQIFLHIRVYQPKSTYRPPFPDLILGS